MNTVIVTRHAALVEYLREIGLADEHTPVLEHATKDDIRGCVILGPCPRHFAAEAASVVDIPLDLPRELRGKELTLEELRKYARAPVEYQVRLSQSGYLQQLADLREAHEIWPGAEYPMQAMDAALRDWAIRAGLEEAEAWAPELVPEYELPHLVALSHRVREVPPPRPGQVTAIMFLRGTPCVRVEMRLRTCASSRTYRLLDLPAC